MPFSPSITTSGVPQTSSTVYLGQSSAIGIAAGTLAGFVFFPFAGLKKRYQTGQLRSYSLRQLLLQLPKLPPDLQHALRIRELWRGGSGFTASSALTTGLQKLTHDTIQIHSTVEDQTTPAIVGGAFGAFASTAVESLMLNQQRLNKGPAEAFRFIMSDKGRGFSWSNFPRVWTGLTGVAMREGIFGYSALKGMNAVADNSARLYRNAAQNSPGLLAHTPYVALSSQLLYGILMSLLSHPADTIASRMQLALHLQIQTGKKRETGFLAISRQVYAEGGVSAFFEGALPRAALFTGCMLTISSVIRKLDSCRADIEIKPD